MDEQRTVSSPVEVFYAYAPANKKLQEKLATHLGLLRQQGLISEWHERLIPPGTDIQQAVDEHLLTASVILLLISPDFFASDYCYGVLMQRALKRHAAGEAFVIPILLRPVDWQSIPLSRLQCLPRNKQPVTSWANRDEAFSEIAREIRYGIESLYTSAGSPFRLPPFSPPATSTASKSVPVFMAPDPPADFVQRPEEFDALKRHLLHGQRNRPTAITAALRGAGGYGKTTLAQALCYDPGVRAAFPDGVLWVTLGEHTPSLVGKIEDLLYLLTHERPGFTHLEAATARLKAVLEDRSLLLVIDDVWYASDLTPFLQGGPHCARLITTRNDATLPDTAERIVVDAMSQQEAVQLLQAGLSIAPGTEEPIFRTLAARLIITHNSGMLPEREKSEGEATWRLSHPSGASRARWFERQVPHHFCERGNHQVWRLNA